mgnify:CR=1 FL=1
MAFPVPTVGSSSAGSNPITIPARTAGDLIVLLMAAGSTIASNPNAKFSSVAAVDGVSWNLIGHLTGAATFTDYVSAYYLFAGSTAASSTIAVGNGTSWYLEQSAYAVVVTGAHASTPPEWAAIAGLDPPNLDPVGWGTEDTLWLAHMANFSGTPAGPSGFTNIGSGANGRLGYLNSATSSLNPSAFTGGSAGSVSTIAIRPAAVAASNPSRMLQFF